MLSLESLCNKTLLFCSEKLPRKLEIFTLAEFDQFSTNLFESDLAMNLAPSHYFVLICLVVALAAEVLSCHAVVVLSSVAIAAAIAVALKNARVF